METDTIVEQVRDKFVWKAKYTIVLVVNAIYIVLFYFLMQSYA